MLKLVKDCIRKTSRSLGYDIVPLRDLRERDFAIHLGQLFRYLAIDCVIDVGANVGQYRDFLRNQVLFSGLIVSFEPVSQNVATLEARSKLDPRWVVEGYALGRESGALSINVMKSDQFSSFLEPDNQLVPAFAGLNDTAHRETVEVRTLDQVFPKLQARLGFRRPHLKLDTQGFDLEVLRGGTTVLPSIYALQTEASIIGIYKGMPNYMEAIQFLNMHHFDVTGLYPVSRDRLFRVIEVDCVMLNRAIVSSPQLQPAQ